MHEGLHIRIGDRGLSWDLFPEEYSRLSNGDMCPIKWMSAEAISGSLYSHYSDVVSVGREGGKEGGRKGRREGEGGEEGGREGGREEGKEGGRREGGSEGRREGGEEGRRKGRREGARGGGLVAVYAQLLRCGECREEG